MAINEKIVTGRKYRRCIDDVNKIWQRISFWSKASDTEFNDGKTAEEKVGAINGISSSSTSTASDIAASIGYVNQINSNLTTNLSGLSFGQDSDGNWGYKVGGADPVIPFKSGSNELVFRMSGWGYGMAMIMDVSGYSKMDVTLSTSKSAGHLRYNPNQTDYTVNKGTLLEKTTLGIDISGVNSMYFQVGTTSTGSAYPKYDLSPEIRLYN